MNTFTESSNALLLHGAISGVHLVCDLQPVEWINLCTAEQFDYAAAIADIENADVTNVEEWYGLHWKLFPFGELSYENLSEVKKLMVFNCAAFVGEMVEQYGARLREVNE